ncbi:MAG: McrBC 5-methylcytosine restriction system component [Bacteroidetes bacterium]|nr:McrBC 5-methylcytosine restriction system component [Bacteroidota bacterium]
MKIPIQNIYYLLCYAWNKLDEGERVNVSSSDYENSIELYARVILNGCKHLFKKGLEYNYVNRTYEYTGVKGKIDFKASLTKNLFKQGRAICQFDEYEVDILQNQILKATLKRLLKTNSIDVKLKRELWIYYLKFSRVDDLDVQIFHFSQVRIHRNNQFYGFLLSICQLIIENTALDEDSGTYQFKDFIDNDKKMASLFENFIRNFYRKEQEIYHVRREDISWDAFPIGDSKGSLLPKMQTDITLESQNRKIIIETKFYGSALNTRFDTEKYISSHLYQLYSYLRNLEAKEDHSQNINTEGILLYPTVGYDLNESYWMGTHKITVKTINLMSDWKSIHESLIGILN